jgi:hypothetical protein
MLSIAEVRKILRDTAKDLSDEEIKEIAEVVDRLADVLFEMWLVNRHDPKFSKP